LPQTHGLREYFFCISIVAIITSANLDAIFFCIDSKSHDHKANILQHPVIQAPSPYLSALFLLYTSKTEYRRGQRRAVVLDQGLLRTVRRLNEWGEAVLRNHVRNLRQHFCFSNCQLPLSFSFFLSFIYLKYISLHLQTTISLFHETTARLRLFTNHKADQRPARHNHKLAAPNRPFGTCAFHNRQRSRIPRF
jgi:hypothetical protein